MTLTLQKYAILKLNRNCFKYKAVLIDAENNERYYVSKNEFKTALECSRQIVELKIKNAIYEENYGKIIETIPEKFDDYYERLIEFFNLCEFGNAELNDWCRIRKLTVKLYESKEITKEEMQYLNNCISFHFKNQGRALELSTLLEKIKQKKGAA